MNDPQIKEYCISIFKLLKHCLQCNIEPRKMIPAIDKAIKHLEENKGDGTT